jgi:hypothetical protein
LIHDAAVGQPLRAMRTAAARLGPEFAGPGGSSWAAASSR